MVVAGRVHEVPKDLLGAPFARRARRTGALLRKSSEFGRRGFDGAPQIFAQGFHELRSGTDFEPAVQSRTAEFSALRLRSKAPGRGMARPSPSPHPSTSILPMPRPFSWTPPALLAAACSIVFASCAADEKSAATEAPVVPPPHVAVSWLVMNCQVTPSKLLDDRMTLPERTKRNQAFG